MILLPVRPKENIHILFSGSRKSFSPTILAFVYYMWCLLLKDLCINKPIRCAATLVKLDSSTT